MDSRTIEQKDEFLSITIGGPEAAETPIKRRMRRPATPAEKKIRLDTHKLHVLCLLLHYFGRNHWCNDVTLQRALRRMIRVSSRLIDKLNPDLHSIQLQRSRIFKEALAKLVEIW